MGKQKMRMREKVEHWKHARLAAEVTKLNPKEERALAEERFCRQICTVDG